MSAQVLELLFFAGLAFFIISRLIAALGSSSEDDPAKRPSFFGGMPGLKDVTNTVSKNKKYASISTLAEVFTNETTGFEDYIVKDNAESITNGINEIKSKVANFNIKNFLNSSKAAFSMIITAAANKNSSELQQLIDRRYIGQFADIALSYGTIKNVKNITAIISEVYMFGNTIFIKIIFSGENIVSNISNFKEEWTFSKSLIDNGPNWHLSNIDRPQ